MASVTYGLTAVDGISSGTLCSFRVRDYLLNIEQYVADEVGCDTDIEQTAVLDIINSDYH